MADGLGCNELELELWDEDERNVHFAGPQLAGRPVSRTSYRIEPVSDVTVCDDRSPILSSTGTRTQQECSCLCARASRLSGCQAIGSDKGNCIGMLSRGQPTP